MINVASLMFKPHTRIINCYPVVYKKKNKLMNQNNDETLILGGISYLFGNQFKFISQTDFAKY